MTADTVLKRQSSNQLLIRSPLSRIVGPRLSLKGVAFLLSSDVGTNVVSGLWPEHETMVVSPSRYLRHQRGFCVTRLSSSEVRQHGEDGQRGEEST